MPINPFIVFADGTASAPKTIGNTSFGRWMQKFSSGRESKGPSTPMNQEAIGSAKGLIGKDFEDYLTKNLG